MDCIFCKIIAGHIPCLKVYEDEHTLVIMDIAGVVDGSLPFGERAQIVSRPLDPPLCGTVAFAWKRDQPMNTAAKKFVEYAKCFLGIAKA